jgi:nicotinic acid mononucleotide adenylyltransferase
MSSDNTLVFTIGRMNPPTPGHMALIEKLIHRAASLGQTKIGILLSH